MALGMDIWMSIIEEYEPPENPPRDKVRNRACEINAKARNFICVD